MRWLLHLKSWDQACLRTGASMQKRIRPEAGVAFSCESSLPLRERERLKARAIPSPLYSPISHYYLRISALEHVQKVLVWNQITGS
jgi:hypothetical protein